MINQVNKLFLETQIKLAILGEYGMSPMRESFFKHLQTQLCITLGEANISDETAGFFIREVLTRTYLTALNVAWNASYQPWFYFKLEREEGADGLTNGKLRWYFDSVNHNGLQDTGFSPSTFRKTVNETLDAKVAEWLTANDQYVSLQNEADLELKLYAFKTQLKSPTLSDPNVLARYIYSRLANPKEAHHLMPWLSIEMGIE